MTFRLLLPLLLGWLLLPAVPAQADDAPFPPGTSSHWLESLKCSIVMPEKFDPAKERSMVVVLHGAGGTETGMASVLAFLCSDDYFYRKSVCLQNFF